MESIKIKRKARTIPFGFKQSGDPDYLEPIREELDALRQAKEYSKTCSLRETAQWLHRKTGRYISHVGLKKRDYRVSGNAFIYALCKSSYSVNRPTRRRRDHTTL